MADQLVDVELYHHRIEIDRFTTSADPEDAEDVEALLRSAVKRDPNYAERIIEDYEIVVRRHKDGGRVLTFTGRRR